MKKLLWCAIALFVAVLLAQSASAKVLGQAGMTYPIVERDAIDEFKEAAAKVDWKKVFSDGFARAEASFGVAPKDVWLPRATVEQTRDIAPSYTLPFDVPNPSNINETLYPAGYTFNPLAFLDMPNDLVFVDVSDKRQMAWLKSEYGKGKKANAIIMLTGGNIESAMKVLDRPVYIANMNEIKQFDVHVVPTVLKQSGVKFIIYEHVPPEPPKGKKVKE